MIRSGMTGSFGEELVIAGAVGSDGSRSLSRCMPGDPPYRSPPRLTVVGVEGNALRKRGVPSIIPIIVSSQPCLLSAANNTS